MIGVSVHNFVGIVAGIEHYIECEVSVVVGCGVVTTLVVAVVTDVHCQYVVIYFSDNVKIVQYVPYDLSRVEGSDNSVCGSDK